VASRKRALELKHCVVTGGSRGIGLGISLELAKNEFFVHIFDVQDISENHVLIPDKNYEFHNIDLRNWDLVKDELNRLDKSSPIKAVVNNARGRGRGNLPEMETKESLKQEFDVSLIVPTLITQEMLHFARADQQMSRSVVNISSISAYLSGGEKCSYHIAKAGLLSMTRYMADVGGRYNLRVNSISPGFIVKEEHCKRFYSESNTEYRDLVYSTHPVRNVGKVKDVGSLVNFLLSDDANFITGQDIIVDGGLSIQDQWNLIYSSTLGQR